MELADELGGPEQIRSPQYRLIERLLDESRLRLGFPWPLERQYRLDHDARAVASFRASIFYTLFMYGVMCLVVLASVDWHRLGNWPLVYSLFGVIIGAAWWVSRQAFFADHYQQSLTVLAFAAVMVAMFNPVLIRFEPLRLLVHVGTVYVMVIIYLGLNLRLPYAMVAGWGGGLAMLAPLWLMGAAVDWTLVLPTYGGGSLLVMVLAYREERQQRKMFLQARLMELDKARIESLAKELQRQSLLDSLTGLANRRYFDQVLKREWRRCRREEKPLSLLFVDVDYFKPYNDQYGHQQGDECLKELGAVLEDLAGRPADLAARYGGEEFLLLYPETDNDQAREMAHRVLKNVRELGIPHVASQVHDVVTVSVGVATVYPARNESEDLLMKRADDALYQAKQGGRNQVVLAADHQAPL